MEIEYKFGIGKKETFDFLSNLSQVGDYVLKDKSHPIFTDTFYDTPDFLLFSLGYYLRKRLEEGKDFAEWTLKKSDSSLTDVHKRHEFKENLSLQSEVTDISNPDILKCLFSLVGDMKLVPILTLNQDRYFKSVYKADLTKEADFVPENILSDLSVDLVHLKFSEQTHAFMELEAELSHGTTSDLKDFVTVLQNVKEIKNDIYLNHLSKFDRGLVLFFNRDKIEGVINGFEKKSYHLDIENASPDDLDSADSGFLMPREKAALLQICEKKYTADPTDQFGSTGFLINNGPIHFKNDLFLKKASLLLALDSGMSLGFAALTYGLSKNEVLSLRRSFEFFRLDIFPFIFEVAQPLHYYFQKPISDGKVWTEAELASFYNINVERSKTRLLNAEKLFTSIGAACGLSDRDQAVLRTSVFLKDIGQGISFERPNISANIILTHPLQDFSLNELKMLGLIFVLDHLEKRAPQNIRKAIRNAGFFVPPFYQKKALILSAFLEIIETADDIQGIFDQITLSDASYGDTKKSRIEIVYSTPNDYTGSSDADFFKPNDFIKPNNFVIPSDSVSPDESFSKPDKSSLNKFIDIVFNSSLLFKSSSATPPENLKKKDKGETKETKEKETKEIKEKETKKAKEKETRDTTLPPLESVVPAFEKPESSKLLSDDMMAEAAEKIFKAQFYDVEKAEPGVISAKDIEDVHDIRVALRKIRSANLIFKNFLDPKWLEETELNVKKMLSFFGVIRDLDVLLEKADAYVKKENIDRSTLSLFYKIVSKDRNENHKKAVEYLKSDEYFLFKIGLYETFNSGVYLGTPRINKKGDVFPVRICDVLPAILYEKAADLTAYHEWLDGPFIYVDKLHRLRIAAKNFRYTLDFFKDCFGSCASQLIKEFKELQDILGDFHDAIVAIAVIDSYISRIDMDDDVFESAAESKKKLAEIETTLNALEKYKEYREREIELLLQNFHSKWESMDRQFFHDRISKIITEANF
ncbi:MAG: CHAD domain-containing protein [Methanimicrococcus sp.]|nr:CHAD domain-containing protein [Methanimicrococcus sp.]